MSSVRSSRSSDPQFTPIRTGFPFSTATSMMRRKCASCRAPAPTLPGLIRYLSRARAHSGWSVRRMCPLKWKSPMIGAVTPAPRTRFTISGTAWAASGVFTVTRTSSEPAWARSIVCCAVARASAVSVLVMDCTATGRPPPIVTEPMRTEVLMDGSVAWYSGGMSTQVRAMFASIARRYDQGNQVLSMGLHHQWRKATVRLSGAKAGDRVLDCATGTGDLAFAFQRAVGRQGNVIGTDFCAEMLDVARLKAEHEGTPTQFEEADTLKLPYDDASFDVASIAFGIRNVDDPALGVREMARVVRPGGVVAVLEFGQPGGALFGPLYRFYSAHVIPRVGGLLTGRRS